MERFGISSTLLIRCRQAGPLRAPLCPPAGLTRLGQGHHGHPGHGLCLPSCRALLSWMLRCIFGGAALGRAPCGLGTSCCLQETKALHGTALHLAIAISGFAMRTHVRCGYCCTGKYEYGGAPCYGTFECSGLALWYRSHPLLRVLRLLQALGNTVCSPLSLVAQASPVFTGICGGDHAGGDTSSYGYSRPLTISTDLWGVPTSNKDGTLQTDGRVGVSSSAAFEWGELVWEDRCLAWLWFIPSLQYYLTQDEAPLNGHISETVIGAHPCSWLDVHRVSRLGVQAAESATTDCLALCTTANLPLTE